MCSYVSTFVCLYGRTFVRLLVTLYHVSGSYVKVLNKASLSAYIFQTTHQKLFIVRQDQLLCHESWPQDHAPIPRAIDEGQTLGHC